MAQRDSYTPVPGREDSVDTPTQEMRDLQHIKDKNDSSTRSDAVASESKPARDSRMSRLGVIQQDSWIFEVAAFLFSLACFIALVILLVVYDGKPAPSLPYSINLNAVIAILGTAIWSSLLFATAAFVSQCKWTHLFTTPRNLHDIQRIDDASRGPLGSIRLLCSGTGKSFASLGAIIIILAIVFDPFLQQIVSYPLLEVSSSLTASTRQALWMSPFLDGGDIIKAVNKGLNTESFSRVPYCPSGNCTWAPFVSAGWCSSCEDATSQIKASPCDIDWNMDHYEPNETKQFNCSVTIASTLPFDLGVSVTRSTDDQGHEGNQLLNLTYANTGFYLSYSPVLKNWIRLKDGHMFNGVWNLFFVFDFWTNLDYADLADTDNPAKNSIAQQCVLTPCLRNYSLQVRNTVARLTTLSTQMQSFYYNESAGRAYFVNSPESWPPRPPQQLEDYNAINPTLFSDAGWRGGLWWVDNYTTMFDWNTEGSYMYKWPSAMNDSLMGSSSVYRYNNCSSSWRPGDATNGGRGNGPNSTNFGYTLIAYAGTPEDILQRIAEALTSYNLDLYYLNDTQAGHVMSPQLHVHVRWAWITMPVIMMATGIAFTILILWTQSPHKVRLWKTSSFVFLHHGPSRGGEDGGVGFSKIQSASAMDELAKRTVAHFETDPGESASTPNGQENERSTPKLPEIQNIHQGLAVQWPV
ncbi:hypothetical protein H2200_001795 [Cladophialophora chaetospira]|uniref:Uncharacterized protein n=1 Tax=Cladophialophora chaetospira TaxID=386627 RepID=A0AA38XMM3_9EURO|nr:hypothetical protein H2200_001795 [Cladophialophora chaetospira]